MVKTKNKNINVYASRENLLTIDATNVFSSVVEPEPHGAEMLKFRLRLPVPGQLK
jgi:hypothetical protein